MISITNFENMIDSKIVDRAREYYKNGFVEYITELEEDHFTAIVSGTENYEVEIRLHDGEIQEHFCDCPYDHGEFCKHEVAVLFSILQQYKTIDIVEESQKTKSKAKAKPKQKVDFSKILDTISHEELKKFVLDYTSTDRNFNNAFISNFAVISGNDSFELYQGQIKDIYRSGKDRYGFIERYQMKKVGNQLLAFLSDIEKYIDQGNLITVFYRSSALLEESIAATQFCDDSDGYLSSLIDGSFSALETIALSELPEDLRKEIMSYCFEVFDKNKFKGWGWHEAMLVLSGKFVKNKKEAEQILIRISGNSEKDNDYGVEKLENLKYDTLLKWKGIDEAEKFLNGNLHNTELRSKAISIAIHNFEYGKAKEIAKEGVVLDRKERPGLVKKWYNHLLKIAELENDQEYIVLYARYLLKDNFYPERDYYEILKKHVAEENWQEFVDEMISDILKQERYRGKYELAASLYIREKRWTNLFELVKKSQSIHFLEMYEEYIKHLFLPEIINLYIQYINSVIDEASSRSNYKSICIYLKKIKKMGAEDKVKEMVQRFKVTFPKKKALIDELDKV
ncbi:hypothetical protein HHL23_10690 [Chryseobacterium sp. RP-3-3]|uniref:SWIM-type domain-containing protein n=1 Tax=Chryseobacterium antibioticum TaxID=2728847 RepID=A0A7Y0AN21_9FLAO|nr:hypothetical protein [Chryseobacterium antibioticum]NML70264.1 hypothetical protein [Chryseobacterium antibioticum]